jgi:benzoylformate decarboxylase
VGTYVFPEVFPLLDNPFRRQAKIVHVDLDAYEIAKNFPVDVALVADPKPTLAALGDQLSTKDGAELESSNGFRRPEVSQDDPMIDQFAAELAEQAGDDLVIFDEALTASPGLVKHIPPRIPGNYFLTRGGSLGVGIPGAVGAKLARPEAQVVGFTGDGGSMYTIQALWTAVRHDVAAKFVICNNHRYELLDANIVEYWRESGVAPHPHPSGFDLSHPELGFVDLARGMQVDGVRVEKPADVSGAVQRMLAEPGPFLVDLVTA